MKTFSLPAFKTFFILGLVLATMFCGSRAIGDPTEDKPVCSHGYCTVTCNAAVFPTCGLGNCNKPLTQCSIACDNGCIIILTLGICECNGNP